MFIYLCIVRLVKDDYFNADCFYQILESKSQPN